MKKLAFFALAILLTMFVGCESEEITDNPSTRTVYRYGEYVTLQFLSEKSSWFDDETFRDVFLATVILTSDTDFFESAGRFGWGSVNLFLQSCRSTDGKRECLYNLSEMFDKGYAYDGYNGSLVMDIDTSAWVRTDLNQSGWVKMDTICEMPLSQRENIWAVVCLYDTTGVHGRIAYAGRYTGDQYYYRFGFGTNIAHKPMESYLLVADDWLKR